MILEVETDTGRGRHDLQFVIEIIENLLEDDFLSRIFWFYGRSLASIMHYISLSASKLGLSKVI